jgi:RNA polymerase sigma factor (sigma-70 family)
VLINSQTPQSPAAVLPLAEALRRLAERRDTEAWEALLIQCGQDLLRVTRRILGDAQLAEDACQETLLQIRAHAGSFKAPAHSQQANFAARIWIMRIASNIAISMARSRNRAQRRDDTHAVAASRVEINSPAERKLREEENEWLRQEIATLPETLREPVLLRFFGELDYSELGDALSCSPDAAKKRVQRGLDHLRSRLAILGVSLTLAELSAHMLGGSAHAAEAAAISGTTSAASATLNASQQLAWKALLNASAAPALSGVVPLGGISIMVKLAMTLAGLAIVGSCAVLASFSVSGSGSSSAPTTVQTPSPAKAKPALDTRDETKDEPAPAETKTPAPKPAENPEPEKKSPPAAISAPVTPPPQPAPAVPPVEPAPAVSQPAPAVPPVQPAPAEVPPVKKAAPAVPDKSRGILKGRVKYNGEPPAPKKIKVPPSVRPDCHHDEIVSDDLVVDPATRGIKWAMIRVMGVKDDPLQVAAPDAPQPTIDQKGCMFQPHVVVVPPGFNLTVLNSEHAAHNFHTTPLDATNPGYNRMQTPADEKAVLKGEKYFPEPEIIKIQCDIHPWMNGFIVVHDSRYAAISAADGTFEISHIPPGKYDISVFHELGEQTFSVEIKAGETKDMEEILFPAKAK